MKLIRATLFSAAALFLLAGEKAQAAGGRHRAFPNSIKEVPAGPGGEAQIVRRQLTAGEWDGSVEFAVALRMRNFDELQARLAAGEKISPEEMEARYLPASADYDRVTAWLAAQGFTRVIPDRNHTTVVVRGTVSQAAQALGVTFARVAVPAASIYPTGEYTSAVTAPSLPEDLAGVVLAIEGLQPHIRFRHVRPSAQARALPLDSVQGFLFATPNDVAAAYNVPTAWTGRGQTIAIVDEAAVSASDLNTFWSTVGVKQTSANVATVSVAGGASPSGDAVETALDVEWAGAMAPEAQIRLYLSANVFNCLIQILNDLPSHPTMTVASVSYGLPENGISSGSLQFFAQLIAQAAASGLTVFASSGDGGSNPSLNDGSYGATNALFAEYPASDPNATGVGGTTLAFDSKFNATGETVWNFLTSQAIGSGGGISVFSAPSWQTGTPNRARRCVPDVSAIAAASSPSGSLGAFVYITTSGKSSLHSVVGTSLSAPVWAAFGAEINQARAAAGLSPVGLLGPRIYPLGGTSAFADVTQGSNGAYSAAPGYDLCTGLGSPNVGNLIAALAGSGPLPSIAVDGHKSGDTVVVPGGGTPVTIRFGASDPARSLSGIRYNIWNPPAGSTTPLAGFFNNGGGGFTAVSGSAGETDQTVTLTPGDWYFWTDAQDSSGDTVSTGAWTGGYVLHVVAGSPGGSAPTANAAPAATIGVDGYRSGDMVPASAGQTVKVTVRYGATDSSANLSGIRFNVWAPGAGSAVAGTGSFNNGNGFIGAGGSSGEVDQVVTLAAGDWYFWTDAMNSAGGFGSTGAWNGGFVLHVGGTGTTSSSAPSSDAAPVPSITVDGHNAGDTVKIPAGGTVQLTVRYKATDSSNNLSGIRYNIWNPPSGNPAPGAGSFSNGGGFTAASGGSGEVDQAVTLTPGDWYFWTDAQDNSGHNASTGAWTAGLVIHAVAGP